MSTNFKNFQVLEVTGATKEEALEKAPFSIMGDATQAYKNWAKKQTDAITEALKKEFYIDYLNKKSKNVDGVGFSITLEPAKKDTRERPYTMINVKNEDGERVWKRTYEIKSVATGETLASTTETQAKAKEIAKNLYIERGLKEDIVCEVTKKVAKGQPVAFKMKYTPSVNAKNGQYIVFGFVK